MKSRGFTGALIALALGTVRTDASNPATEGEPPMIEPVREDFTIEVGQRRITATLLAPPEDKLARHPALLITFGLDRHIALFTHPYSLTPGAFLEHGHRVLSFDMPCHGERVDRYGAGVAGFRDAVVAGVDPFNMCIEDGRAVIAECIKRGWAAADRIAVEGASRAGYMALRLLAADRRIAAGVGMAPVTDWRALSEFAGVRDREDIAELALPRFVGEMADRQVYLAIGKEDGRVSTTACTDFSHDLKKAQREAGPDAGYATLELTDDPGHSINSGYPGAIEFLLNWATKADGV